MDPRPIWQFDKKLIQPIRLALLLELHAAGSTGLSFIVAKDRIKATDGNIASHARTLQNLEMLAVSKAIQGGKPVTTYTITPKGEETLRSFQEELNVAMNKKDSHV